MEEGFRFFGFLDCFGRRERLKKLGFL